MQKSRSVTFVPEILPNSLVAFTIVELVVLQFAEHVPRITWSFNSDLVWNNESVIIVLKYYEKVSHFSMSCVDVT